MAIATSARNSRAGSTPRTTTTGTNARTNSVAQTSSANSARSQNKKVNSFDRNVVVVDPQTGKQRLERNRVVRQNRGQVYQNGRLVADYGVGESAARKAQGFAASIGTSPYSRGQTTVTIGKQESAYAPPSRIVNGREVQTGGPSSRVLPPESTQRIEPRSISQRPAPMFSRLAPVARDQAAEDAARARIAQERGIDVNTASGATISLLDEAVNQDVYGQARPTFGQGALTPSQKAQEQSIAASVRAEPVTPQEVQSIITSEQAKTFRDSEIQDLQEWQAESFGTVSDGFNDLLTSDADIIGAIQGGEDAQGLLEQRRMFYEEQYNSLKSEISRIYSEKASDYKTQAAQQMGSTISQLAAMGALGTTTAGIQYVNDVQRVNSAKLLSFAAEEAAALESAYSAFQEADFKTAQEMIDNAKATREEIRKVKQEQLANQKTMLELKKLEREDASQTIDAMVSSGLDISNLPDGYLEYLDAKGGYAPGTSAGLWNVAQKERALKEEQDAQALYTTTLENSKKVLDIMQDIPIGQTINIDGVDYTGLSREGFQTGSEDDGTDTTVWAVDPISGEVYTNVLKGVSSKDNWEWHETNGVGYWVNNQTQRTVVGYNTNMPLNGMADPNGSLSALEAAFPDGVEGPEGMNPGYKGECAAFVNHVTGLGLGNTWEDKMSKMDASIGFGEGQIMPQSGDVFVMKITANGNGHTGFVTSVQPLEDGTYDIGVMDSNWVKTKDANGNPIGAISHHTINSSRMTGFARPSFKPEYTSTPNELQSALTPSTGADSTVSAYIQDYMRGTASLSSIPNEYRDRVVSGANAIRSKYASTPELKAMQSITNLTSDVRKAYEGNITYALEQGDTEQVRQLLKSSVYDAADTETRSKLDGRQELVDSLATIQSELNNYVSRNGSTNIFKGSLEKIASKIGAISDPELRAIATRIQTSLINYRRAVSGAAFTESEAAQYESLLPSIGNLPGLNNTIINSLVSTFNSADETYYRSRFGSSNYDAIFGSSPAIQQLQSYDSGGVSVDDADWFDNLFR